MVEKKEFKANDIGPGGGEIEFLNPDGDALETDAPASFKILGKDGSVLKKATLDDSNVIDLQDVTERQIKLVFDPSGGSSSEEDSNAEKSDSEEDSDKDKSTDSESDEGKESDSEGSGEEDAAGENAEDSEKSDSESSDDDGDTSGAGDDDSDDEQG